MTNETRSEETIQKELTAAKSAETKARNELAQVNPAEDLDLAVELATKVKAQNNKVARLERELNSILAEVHAEERDNLIAAIRSDVHNFLNNSDDVGRFMEIGGTLRLNIRSNDAGAFEVDSGSTAGVAGRGGPRIKFIDDDGNERSSKEVVMDFGTDVLGEERRDKVVESGQWTYAAKQIAVQLNLTAMQGDETVDLSEVPNPRT